MPITDWAGADAPTEGELGVQDRFIAGHRAIHRQLGYAYPKNQLRAIPNEGPPCLAKKTQPKTAKD